MDEIANYYNIQHSVINDNDILGRELHVIKLSALGLTRTDIGTDEVFKLVGENYPYLVPFFKVFKAHLFERIYAKYVGKITFEEINYIIRTIRKEKSDGITRENNKKI